MAEGNQGIFGLPNEILLNIFSLFATKDLIVYASTSRHVYSLVARILLQRLQVAASLDGYTLYLECGPPAAKQNMSEMFCSELGTSGLQELVHEVQDGGGQLGHLDRMGELFTRFKPVNKEPDFRSVPRPHPAGDVPGSRTYRSPEETAAAWSTYTRDVVTRAVHIDADCQFSQLQTIAYLGRRESTRGLLYSIQEVCDGTIRVWRDWLSKQCETKHWTDGEPVAVHHDNHDTSSSSTSQGIEKDTSLSRVHDPQKNSAILWPNTRANIVGIKFRVIEKKWLRDNPVLFDSETDVPVSYNVELKEIFIRTTHLLLKLEESRKQNLNKTGKAMVFGSFTE